LIERVFPLVTTVSVAFALLLGIGLGIGYCQQPVSPATADSNTTYIFAGIGGFIPTQDAYRINYSTKTAALPVEVNGGFLFPVSHVILVPLTVRYIRREAIFVSGMSIGVLSLEPGVRFFLEPARDKDLRLFAGVEGLLVKTSVSGVFDLSSDGSVTGSASNTKDYFNYGAGLDLGLTYPLTHTTALDGIVHVAFFFGDPVEHGGLGNIGGVSLVAAYRFGF